MVRQHLLDLRARAHDAAIVQVVADTGDTLSSRFKVKSRLRSLSLSMNAFSGSY
jgi:hypothetical protein